MTAECAHGSRPVRECSIAFSGASPEETLFLLPKSCGKNVPSWCSSASLLLPDAFFPEFGALAPLAVGTCLYADSGPPLLQITSRLLLPGTDLRTVPACTAQVRRPLVPETRTVRLSRPGFTLAWITLSDKGARGERPDASGPLVADILSPVLRPVLVHGCLLPDDPLRLRSLVADLALHQGFDCLVACGGTGLGPRDTTPEAVMPLLEKRLPGFEQAMMAASLAKTPHAALSRAVAGTLGHSLALTVPGSPRGAGENLQAILPALCHALEKLQNDTSDCAPV